MKNIIFILFYLVLFSSVCFAKDFHIDLDCDSYQVHPGYLPSGLVRIDFFLHDYSADVKIDSNVESSLKRIYADQKNYHYTKAICDNRGVQIHLDSKSDFDFEVGKYFPDYVSDGLDGVHVVSFAVGGLMGLAFAVASVYKW